MLSRDGVRAAIVGGGYMGGGMAQALAGHGIDCVLVDVTAARSRERVQQLHDEARTFADDGLVSEETAARMTAHLRPAESLEEAVASATYVAEVVPEQPDLKKEVLARISSLTGPDVVIGTNTSALPIGELALSVRHPERFLGVHWMNPAPFVPGVEVIPASGTSQSVVSQVLRLLDGVGKVPTIVGDSPGFVANRLQFALFREAIRIVEDGIATPADIDEVVSHSFGFRLPFFGPFAIADIAGLDVYRDGFATMERAFGERIGTPALLVHRVEQGHHGLKTGRGFYELGEGRTAEVARYRDRAYAGLTRLREHLGRVPLTEEEAAMQPHDERSRPTLHPEAWVAPGAVLVGDLSVSAGSSLWFGVVIRADRERISVGRNSNVQDGAVLHADPDLPVIIGDRVSVGHGAVLHGCSIADDVLVGMRATILNGASVGAGSLVAAGSVVLEGADIPPRSLVAGVPGRVRRQTTEEELASIQANAATYVRLATQHAGGAFPSANGM